MAHHYIDGLVGPIPLEGNDFKFIPASVQKRIIDYARSLNPEMIYVCDNSEMDMQWLLSLPDITALLPQNMPESEKSGQLKSFLMEANKKMEKVPNYIVSKNSNQPLNNNTKILGRKEDAEEKRKEIAEKFMGCMRARILFVVPFSMGAIGGSSGLGLEDRLGVQLTDSPLAVTHLFAETSLVSPAIWDLMTDKSCTFGIHSIGWPRPVLQTADPLLTVREDAVILQNVDNKEVWCFGCSLPPIPDCAK